MLKFLASLIILLWCSNALAVCDATLTVCPSGCDYNVLNNAVTDLETNCASPSSPLTIEISGSWSSADTTAVGISGITTSATNTLTIYTTGSARHDGTAYKSGAYKLITGTVATYSPARIEISTSYVTLDGLIVAYPGDGNYNCTVSLGSYNTIKNSVVYRSGSGGNAVGIWIGNFCVAFNNIIHGFTTGYNNQYGGISTNGDKMSFSVYNNTTYNNYFGMHLGCSNYSTCYAKNNLAVGNTSYDLNIGGETYSTKYYEYNISSDTTATGTGSLTNKTAANQFVSLTSGSEDLHLKSGADAIDHGVDLSGTFTTDIDGQTRSGTWDIGADEYVSAGATSATVILGNAVLNNARLLQ